MWSLPATKSLELGAGLSGTLMRGSEHNDKFVNRGDRIGTATNRSGGIQGGISNGEDIVLRIGFKPVATILQPGESVDREGNPIELEGREHDPCVLPRAVPLVEAMACLVLADHALRQRSAPYLQDMTSDSPRSSAPSNSRLALHWQVLSAWPLAWGTHGQASSLGGTASR